MNVLFAPHLLRGLVFSQSAGAALATLNWTAFQMGEIFIRVSAQNCHSEMFESTVGGEAAVVSVPPSE